MLNLYVLFPLEMLITLLQNMLQSDGADAYIKERRKYSKYVTITISIFITNFIIIIFIIIIIIFIIITIIVIIIIIIIREHDAKPHVKERKQLLATSPAGFLNSTVSNAVK